MRNRFIQSRALTSVLAGGLACGLVGLALAPAPVRAATGDIFAAQLTAAAVVPDPGPEGVAGTATLWSYSDRPEICFQITVDGLPPDDTVTGAAVQAGEAGAVGDVVLALFSEPTTESPIEGCLQDLDPQLQDDLFAAPASYYVSVATEAYPDGAVRGQLELTSAPGTGQCEITVEPSTVVVGDEFVIAGDWVGYAEIYLVQGENASQPGSGAEPAATVAEDTEVSVAFTARAADIGVWTAWAMRPETHGCVGSAVFTIVAAPPDTAMQANRDVPAALGIGLLVLATMLLRSAPATGRDRAMR